MHELAITQAILDLALDHARRAGAARVTAVEVVVGELSGYLPDSIRFYFDALSEGTAAGGAALRFRRVPLRLACDACGFLFAPDGLTYDCARCGASRTRVAEGRELQVEAIDVEDAP